MSIASHRLIARLAGTAAALVAAALPAQGVTTARPAAHVVSPAQSAAPALIGRATIISHPSINMLHRWPD